MKKFIKLATSLALVFACTLIFTACGQADFKIDANQVKIDGVTITLEKEIWKKLFSLENEDSQARVDQFAKYGELDEVTINVEGTVSRADCVENATAMDANGNPVTADTTVNYYTDSFEFSMKIPENATKYVVSDGLPAKEIAELENAKDGYIVENVQWLLGGADQTGWTICGNAQTNDGYFYYAFLDENEEVVKEFFVRVVYDVEFVD